MYTIRTEFQGTVRYYKADSRETAEWLLAILRQVPALSVDLL